MLISTTAARSSWLASSTVAIFIACSVERVGGGAGEGVNVTVGNDVAVGGTDVGVPVGAGGVAVALGKAGVGVGAISDGVADGDGMGVSSGG